MPLSMKEVSLAVDIASADNVLVLVLPPSAHLPGFAEGGNLGRLHQHLILLPQLPALGILRPGQPKNI